MVVKVPAGFPASSASWHQGEVSLITGGCCFFLSRPMPLWGWRPVFLNVGWKSVGGTQCCLGFDARACAVPQASFCDFPKYKYSVPFVCLFLTSKNLGEIWGLGGMVLTFKKEILHVGTAMVAARTLGPVHRAFRRCETH